MPPIGIIGAMDSEVDNLITRMADTATVTYAGRRFVTGTLAEKDVVVVKSGIGKVAAAITAQMLIDRFGVDTLLNTGMAGGLDPRLAVKDLVVATHALQHDFDLTAFGHARGYIGGGGDDTVPTRFAADEALIDKALAAAAEVMPAGSKAITGTIASGDIFVDNSTLKAALRDDFGAAAAEMEGAAIAQAAADNGIPFMILRTISDLAEQHASVSFDELERYAGQLAGDITTALLRSL